MPLQNYADKCGPDSLSHTTDVEIRGASTYYTFFKSALFFHTGLYLSSLVQTTFVSNNLEIMYFYMLRIGLSFVVNFLLFLLKSIK